MNPRQYVYVGPPEILASSAGQAAGAPINSVMDLKAWLESFPTEQVNGNCWVATFTIGLGGELRVAPRRSEHVACASGGPVYSAGEMTIDRHFDVVEISNQS